MNCRINTVAEAIAQLQEIGLTVHRAAGGMYRVFDRTDPQYGFRSLFTAAELIDQARYERDMVARMCKEVGVSSWDELQAHAHRLYEQNRTPHGGDAA